MSPEPQLNSSGKDIVGIMSQRYSGSTRRTGRTTDAPRTSGRNEGYVRGNAVRHLNAEPAYKPKKPERVLTPEEEHAKRQRQIASRRNCQKAKTMNLGYVVFLSVATLVCAITCGVFIYLQSDINTNMAKVAELQTQVSDLKERNDAAEKRIETSVDLEQIKQKAINELGMKYPAADQVITYSVQSSDYMNQYGSVPEN